MRSVLTVLALLLAPAMLPAQGSIIPRPCTGDVCVPPRPCPPDRCRNWDASIVRTASDVRVALDDRVLSYEVTETFVNRGGRVGEADYLFPLPKGAAFQDLKLSINGELVSGETLNAAEARAIYEEIVRRQRDPALVEWMGYGLLRTRIFPIAPGEEKKVVVRFQMVAEREGDAVRVDYFRGAKTGRIAPVPPRPVPMPRPRAGAEPDEERGAREGRASFVLTYPSGGRYGTAYSPTHALRTSERAGRTRVEVRGDASEVTILLPVRRSSAPAITVLAHDPSREDGFALITLSPPSSPARATPRDVTLVLDVSGSMSGRKLEQAKAAGKQLLATLAPRDRFRIIDFSSDVRSFRDDYVSASAANVDAAEEYLDDLRANGSTNISGALAEALSAPAEGGRMPLVLFLTDGEPTVGERRPEAIADEAARLRGRRRIFTFGVGADVNVPLVEQLALEGRGTAHFVRPEESVERVVGLVASRLTNPVATDLRLRAEGVRFEKLHPAGPIDLFAGQDLVILARYEGSGDARIRFEGQTADGPVQWTTRVSLPERERDNAFIPRLWATQRVGWLSAEKRRAVSDGAGSTSELDAEIRELGERYGIPTEFTSYFVKEPGMVVDVGPRDLSGRAATGAGGVAGQRLDAIAATAAPAPSRRERAFAEAKQAEVQRSVTSLADADASAGTAEERSTTRRAGNRVFVLRDSVWTDVSVAADAPRLRIKAYSPAYFKLLELVPSLRETLALGDRVIVAGKAVAVEVGPEGVETLSRKDVESIEASW